MASSTRSARWPGVLAVGLIGAGLAWGQAPAGNGAPAQPADNGAQAPPADAGEHVTAKWVQKKTRFVYQGFTTHYSCDGLRDQLRDILRQLGARPDMKLNSVGCVHGFGQPEPFPMVDATFYVLLPADTAGASDKGGGAGAGGPAHDGPSSSAPVDAQWQTVQVQLGNTPLDQAGMCELLEQVNHHILPLFSPRKVDFRSSCVPHQLTVGATLTAEVLKPVPSGPGSAPKA